MDNLKHMEKAGEISKDEHHAWMEEIQSLTDSHIKQVDEVSSEKEKEIMQI